MIRCKLHKKHHRKKKYRLHPIIILSYYMLCHEKPNPMQPTNRISFFDFDRTCNDMNGSSVFILYGNQEILSSSSPLSISNRKSEGVLQNGNNKHILRSTAVRDEQSRTSGYCREIAGHLNLNLQVQTHFNQHHWDQSINNLFANIQKLGNSHYRKT